MAFCGIKVFLGEQYGFVAILVVDVKFIEIENHIVGDVVK